MDVLLAQHGSAQVYGAVETAAAPVAIAGGTVTLAADELAAALPDSVTRALLQSYVRMTPPWADAVAHYEHLVRTMLGRIVAENPRIDVVVPQAGVHVAVVFTNDVVVTRPTTADAAAMPRGLKASLTTAGAKPLTPEEACVRRLNYSVTVHTSHRQETYALLPVPPACGVQLPPDPLPSMVQLPTLYAEARRCTIWWAAAAVPDALEHALDADVAALHAAVLDAAPVAAETMAPPLALPSASELLEEAGTNLPSEDAYMLLRALLLDWAAARARQEARLGLEHMTAAAKAAWDVVAAATPPPAPHPTAPAAAATAPQPYQRWQHQYREELSAPPVHVRELPTFQLPCMTGSSFCTDVAAGVPVELGGVFITRGTRKVVRSQKVQRSNQIVVLKGSHGGPVTGCVRSQHPDKFRSTSTLTAHLAAAAAGSSMRLTFDVPFLPKKVSAVAVFRLLGFAVAEVPDLVWAGADSSTPVAAAARRVLAASLAAPDATAPMDDLYNNIGRGMREAGDTIEKRRRQVQQQVTSELLPHVGYDASERTRLKKGVFLGILVRRMLEVHVDEAAAEQCRAEQDFEGNKAVELSAVILSRMLRQMWTAYLQDLRHQLFGRVSEGKYVDAASFMLRMDSLTAAVSRAFANGEVTVQKEAANSGMATIVMLQTGNHLTEMTDVQRVSTALPRDGKYPALRDFDPSRLGVYGAYETPEGAAVGLLENPTIFARARLGADAAAVTHTVLRLGPFAASVLEADGGSGAQLAAWAASARFVRPFRTLADLDTPAGQRRGVLVFVNGNPVAVTDNGVVFATVARAARRSGVLPTHATISRAPYGILVSCDIGVMTFPLLHLPSLPRLADAVASSLQAGVELWAEAVRLGVIEYVDAAEAAEYTVAATMAEVAEAAAAAAARGEATLPYTHVAPHPQAWFTIAEATVPYPDHNQAPRNVYQSAMAKQACGAPRGDVAARMDMPVETHVLWYPQRPLAATDVANAYGLTDAPSGVNMLIAFNLNEDAQEDGIKMSKAFTERGGGRATKYTVYTATACDRLGARGDAAETFEHPLMPSLAAATAAAVAADTSRVLAAAAAAAATNSDEAGSNSNAAGTAKQQQQHGGSGQAAAATIAAAAVAAAAHASAAVPAAVTTAAGMAAAAAAAVVCDGIRGGVNYDTVGLDGLPQLGTPLGNGDVVIGKTLTTIDELDASGPRRVRVDRSVVRAATEGTRAIVDRVLLTTNDTGDRLVRVRLRSTCDTQPGDKYSAAHGQKGVVSQLVSQEDMPFVMAGPNAGVSPDAIVCVHSVNSRMTIGMLLEMLMGNCAVTRGEFADATPFKSLDVAWVVEQLTEAGELVNVQMACGMTGEPLEGRIFLGLCWYQRLRHLVDSKWTARQVGPYALATRQPTEGRHLGGGQRVGDMEKAAFVAHGAAYMLNDRLRDSSDAYIMPVCLRCGAATDTASGHSLSALMDVTAARGRLCRMCSGPTPQADVPTVYCFALLQREVAAAGIQVLNQFEDGSGRTRAPLPLDQRRDAALLQLDTDMAPLLRRSGGAAGAGNVLAAAPASAGAAVPEEDSDVEADVGHVAKRARTAGGAGHVTWAAEQDDGDDDI